MREGARLASLLWLLAAPATAQSPASPPVPLAGPALAAELAQARIEVSTAFAGADLIVFGATDRLIGPQGENVVVLGLGPPETVTVRRRVRWLGIWVNGPAAVFREVPSFYALAATTPLPALLDEETRREGRLGLDLLAERLPGPRDPAYREALAELRREAGAWTEDNPVEIAGGRLFHARLPLPATVSTGDHAVQVLLVRQGRVVARQELPFRVERVGTAARIADVSRERPLLYGLVCVALAAFAGWLGSVIFRRG